MYPTDTFFIVYLYGSVSAIPGGTIYLNVQNSRDPSFPLKNLARSPNTLVHQIFSAQNWSTSHPFHTLVLGQ